VYSEIAGVKLGDGHPVRLMGIINASRESFYKSSVRSAPDEIAALAANMVAEGVDIIDVGGMSTAPSSVLKPVSIEEESSRLKMAIKAIRAVVQVPISVDTPRAESARAALETGATIVNDVSGFKHDPEMKELVAKKKAYSILMAHESQYGSGTPINRIKSALRESLSLATAAGIPESSIVVDPGLGFFRREGGGYGFSLSKETPWYVWDSIVISKMEELRELGRPICTSISRKSFIGKILQLEDPDERLSGSLAATAISVFNGVDLVRTHDVGATLQAAKIARAIRSFSAK
jgi:dihydropteroate synthase